ncbi:MAG TPA: Lrp/AsnC family transcriptional regulator [Chthoniobacterales bacterium]
MLSLDFDTHAFFVCAHKKKAGKVNSAKLNHVLVLVPIALVEDPVWYDINRMLPVEHNDPINERILAISEDKLEGFVREPFQEIARRTGLDVDTVMSRIASMLQAGTVRRVRQTLLATNLAKGALVAWKLPETKIETAFEQMFRTDPFSGHVVLRSTDTLSAGSDYKLWTTVKVPYGFSLEHHCEILAAKTGADRFRIMPAKGIFSLGVGHVRRRTIEPGSRADSPARMIEVRAVELDEGEWNVLLALKREFAPDEIQPTPWRGRAAEAGVSLEEFYRIAEELNARKIIGRFSTFLEHVKPSAGGLRVTRFNALFHWAVPAGREVEAGGEVGRHHILTHCYWREGGPEFRNVNIMAVAHGTDKGLLLEHKAAIDAHLAAAEIPVSYTNVFWGGRSEIKPSEISPMIYREWLRRMAPLALIAAE